MRRLLVVCLIGAFLLMGCTTQAPTAQAPAAQAPAEWVVVAAWKGSGIKSTETFTVSSKEWRILWETKNEAFPGAGIFQIFVNNEKGDLIALAANNIGPGGDVSYVRGAGEHYLDINSANIDWWVVVEEKR